MIERMVLTIVGVGAIGGLIGAHLFWCDLAVWKLHRGGRDPGRARR